MGAEQSRLILLASAALGMGGCAAAMQEAQQNRQLQEARYRATIPVCTTDKGCEAAWAAARNWVTSNCAKRIQTYTHDFIETYNPLQGDVGLSCRVSKNPLPNGSYRILVDAYCGNMFGCIMDPWQAANWFNAAVGRVIGEFEQPEPDATPWGTPLHPPVADPDADGLVCVPRGNNPCFKREPKGD